MGQIVSSAAKPKRCNLNKLSQLGTPAAGEYILVSSDNSMNAAGQGNFDCYIVGDGSTTATELELKSLVDDGAFDISAYRATGNVLAKYVDLSAALDGGNNIPEAFRKGGISVKFVQSSDNKYVQYFLTKEEWSTNDEDWEKINLEEEISQLGQKVVTIAEGKNLLDPSRIIQNAYINGLNGSIVPSSGYGVTDFIPVNGNNLYFNKPWYGGSNGGAAVYDENKQYLRSLHIHTKAYTYQSGDGFVRWSFVLNNLPTAQIEIGNSETTYEPYNPIDGYLGGIKQDVGEIQTEIEEINNQINNQINAKDNSTDFEKNITESESFQHIYPVDIKIGSYRLTYTNGVSVSTGTYLRYYFEDNTYTQTGKIGANGDQAIAFSKNVVAIRIMTNGFVSGGMLDMHFEDLNKKLAIREQVDENTTDIEEIKDVLNLESKDKFLRAVGTLTQGGQKLSLGENNVANNKHLAFSCYFSTFGRIRVGHGYNMATASWIEIDATNLYIYRSTPDAPAYTIAHGLTIQNNLQVSIDLADDGYPLITIQSMGAQYQFTHWTWYGTNGDVFAESVTGTYSNCVLSWTCNGYSADIHVYGDSYCGHLNNNRWPYYTLKDNYNNYLLDAYGGKTSSAAYNTFLGNILHCTPKYALWLMGMNDLDSSSAVNATWLTKIQLFIAKCEEQHIIPILATIPNVPHRIMTFKNNWVRNSGYRYIDFAKAVNAESEGSSWYSGMLSDDNVHPTPLGAATLYMEVIADFPEIMSYPKITTINTHINP